MPYCQQCGAEAQERDAFCTNCGRSLESGLGPAGRGTPGHLPSAGTQVAQMDVIITPLRIVVMSVLTYGLYLFYWFYVTWKHYRDHTGQEAYPVWHALTLLVPIYGLFRTHAHVRTYRELMATADITTTLSASLAVVLMLISNVLDWSSFPTFFGGEITRDLSTFTTTIDLISIAIVVGLILHIQGNLNSYWIHVRDSTSGVVSITSARIGVGEIVFGIIGALSWLETASVLLG